MLPLNLNLYRVKEVGSDYVVLADDAADVRITFAGGSGSGIDNDPPTTKEENAQFFKRSVPLLVGLETPVVSVNEPRTINLFLDHFVDLFGWLRSVPFPFPVSRIEVKNKGQQMPDKLCPICEQPYVEKQEFTAAIVYVHAPPKPNCEQHLGLPTNPHKAETTPLGVLRRQPRRGR